MDLVEIKKVVGKIQSSLFKNSNSYSIGMLKTHFRGSGLQFRDHQVYATGDDVRFIDWKILAKTNTPYIKTFEEERNVEIVVIVDASATMFAGWEGKSKLQAAIELCCLLYLLAKETNDYIHVSVIADEIIYLPKKQGEDGIVTLVATLEKKGLLDEKGRVNQSFRPTKQVPEAEKIVSIMKHLHKRREIVLFSDFNDFFDLNALKKIIYKSNVHCFQILSPLDLADKLPYSLFTSDLSGNKSLSKVVVNGERNLMNKLGRKVKTLKVHQRYLEDFIKEML